MELIKVPRRLIYDKRLGDKRIISYVSLLFHCWDSKECNIPDLALYCGYATNRHACSTGANLKSTINAMSESGYITITRNLKKSFTFYCAPPYKSYGVIYKHEFDKILEYRKEQFSMNGSRINHGHLLLLLAYIRLNMEKAPGRPEVHYSMIKTIVENTGLSPRSIASGLKVLESISIIHNETLPRIQDDDGKWHTNLKIFVDMQNTRNLSDYDWRKEIEKAKSIILARQRNITGG